MFSLQQWAELTKGLQSPDGDVRQQAEKLLSEQKAQHLDHACTSLLEVAVAAIPTDVATTEQALVILRSTLDDQMSDLSSETQDRIKKMLLQTLTQPHVMTVRRKVALCIEEIIAHSSEWPELFPLLVELAKTGNDGAEIVMFMMSNCVGDIGLPMSLKHPATVEALLDFSQSAELNKKRVPLLLSLALEASELECHLKKLIPHCIQYIKQCGDDWEEISTSVVEAVQTEFFDDHVPDMLEALFSTKSSVALESIATLLHAKLKPEYVKPVIDYIFIFLAAYDDDISEWVTTEDDEADEEDVQRAKECLDRLAKEEDIGEECVLPAVFSKVEGLLRTSNWKEQLSCLSALGIIAEYMKEEAMLAGSVQIGLVNITNENPRLRHGAWTLLAQLAKDHGPDLQREEVISQLLEAYANSAQETVTRVNVRCLLSYMYVGAGLDREEALEWAPRLMPAFGSKLSCVHAQKAALGSIGALCSSLEDDAAKYYDDLMPRLKQMMNALSTVDASETLGEVFDCQSRLGSAVGKERFTADATEIMTGVVSALGSENETLKENAMIAIQRISDVLDAEVFAQWLPAILPNLFARLSDKAKEVSKGDLPVEMLESMVGEDNGDEGNFALSYIIDPATGEAKIIFIKTSALQDLKSAIDCLHTLVTKLGTHFGPYFQKAAVEIVPLIEFVMDEEVRDIACMVWGELIKMARLHEPKVLAEMVLKFVDGMVSKWNNQGNITNVRDTDAQAAGVVSCIKNAGPGVLDAHQVTLIGKSALTQLKESLEREVKETDDGYEEEIETEKSLRCNFSDVMGALMEHYLTEFNTHLLQPYSEVIQHCFQQTDPKEQDVRVLGLYMAADVFKYMPVKDEIWSFLIPRMVQNVDVSTGDDIIQNSAYNLGVAALKPEFAPFVQETAKRCAAVIQQRRSKKKLKDEQLQMGVDNCLFALGNLLVTHKLEPKEHSDLWKCWVHHLPCRADLEEGPKVHALFTNLVKSRHDGLMNDWTNVLRIFAEIYKTEMSDDDTNQEIRNLVSIAGQQSLARYAGVLPVRKQKKLLRVLNEASCSPCEK
eukprot:GEMP01006466.1.p1 GENE.GEMP01006466.1~~GEMP01006466.1.p1  ORF type:complete len:1083 (+),score=253.57 GEMP01006466.1:78-3251(+)